MATDLGSSGSGTTSITSPNRSLVINRRGSLSSKEQEDFFLFTRRKSRRKMTWKRLKYFLIAFLQFCRLRSACKRKVIHRSNMTGIGSYIKGTALSPFHIRPNIYFNRQLSDSVSFREEDFEFHPFTIWKPTHQSMGRRKITWKSLKYFFIAFFQFSRLRSSRKRKLIINDLPYNFLDWNMQSSTFGTAFVPSPDPHPFFKNWGSFVNSRSSREEDNLIELFTGRKLRRKITWKRLRFFLIAFFQFCRLRSDCNRKLNVISFREDDDLLASQKGKETDLDEIQSKLLPHNLYWSMRPVSAISVFDTAGLRTSTSGTTLGPSTDQASFINCRSSLFNSMSCREEDSLNHRLTSWNLTPKMTWKRLKFFLIAFFQFCRLRSVCNRKLNVISFREDNDLLASEKGKETDQDQIQSKRPANGEKVQSESSAKSKRRDLAHVFPKIGLEFPSVEEAFDFYQDYSRKIGFTVRKGKVARSSDGTIKTRIFLCSREGFRTKPSRIRKYHRKETRTGCKAYIQITSKDGKWVLTKCSLEHNHELAKRGSRNLVDLNTITPESSSTKNASDQSDLDTNDPETSLTKYTSDGGATMRKEGGTSKYAGPQKLGLVRYFPERRKSTLQPEEVQSLMNCFSRLQVEDPSFFYAIQVDAENCMTNFFWRDGRSRMDYDYFGDVLVLDTTFQMGNLICAPFWGINHHQQCVLFACAFLLDNTLDSYVWLLRTFMEAMGNHQPRTIYTDESQAMASALKRVFPDTRYRIGLNFIYKNAKQHLSTYFEQPHFKTLFDLCIFHCQSQLEFQKKWDSLFELYNLQENQWLSTLFKLRGKWSRLFSGTTYSAGIEFMLNSTKISNVIFENSTRQEMTLLHLVEQYVEAAEQLRLEEMRENLCCYKPVSIRPRKGMDKHAEDVYTRRIFGLFDEEFYAILSLAIEEVQNFGSASKFKLIEGKEVNIVSFDSTSFTITCSCAMFESVGILCRHALKVLNVKNIFQIPSRYIMKRWTKAAKEGVVVADLGKYNMPMKIQSQWNFYSRNLMHKALNVISKSVAISESRKIVESYLDKALKEVDSIVKCGVDEHRLEE